MISNEEFNQYYKQYGKLLEHISIPYSKNLDLDDIKSCQLEILWHSIKSFNPNKGKFTTYLYHNLTRKLNALSKKKNNINISKTEEYTVNSSIDEILECLPKDLRTLIYQKYIDCYSYTDLSLMYNVSKQTIRNRLEKAKLILKKKISGV